MAARDADAANQLTFLPTLAVAAMGMKRAGARGERSSMNEEASSATDEMSRQRLGSTRKGTRKIDACWELAQRHCGSLKTSHKGAT